MIRLELDGAASSRRARQEREDMGLLTKPARLVNARWTTSTARWLPLHKRHTVKTPGHPSHVMCLGECGMFGSVSLYCHPK